MNNVTFGLSCLSASKGHCAYVAKLNNVGEMATKTLTLLGWNPNLRSVRKFPIDINARFTKLGFYPY